MGQRLRRGIARIGAGGLLWVGMLSSAQAAGAAGPETGQPAPLGAPPATSTVTATSTAQPTPQATIPATQQPTQQATNLPATAPATPSGSGAAGTLRQPDGTAPTTPSSGASATATTTAPAPAYIAPLVPPDGTTPATPSTAPTTTSTRPPTATLTRTPIPTATSGTTPTSQPTATGTPTMTPTATAIVTALQPPAAIEPLNLTILDDPGIGGNVALARIAAGHYGEYFRPDGVAWSGWCEMFVGNVLAEAGIPHVRYESALADAASGPLYRGRAPAGSLVFFDQRANAYGHVGIAVGDGTMLSALGGGIVRTEYERWSSYLGWRPKGAAAPVTPADAPFLITPLLDAIPVTGETPEMPIFADNPGWYAPPPYRTQDEVIK